MGGYVTKMTGYIQFWKHSNNFKDIYGSDPVVPVWNNHNSVTIKHIKKSFQMQDWDLGPDLIFEKISVKTGHLLTLAIYDIHNYVKSHNV